MVRPARNAVAACIFASALVLGRGEAEAQTLARLHVDALGMHADRSVASVATAIHVTIHVHVREAVASLDNLVLPDLSNLQILGDERRLHTDATGTDYVEALTVTGLAPGIAHLTPAHLDAIDARNGRPTRFSSNDLTIRIEPESGAVAPGPDWRSLALRAILAAIAIVVGCLIVFALVRRVLRRAAEWRPEPAPVPLLALPAPQPRPALERALAQLRTRPSRDEAVLARAALRDFAGAHGDETLETLLLRLNGAPPALRAALRLAERAAFVGDARLHSGIDELIDALEKVLAL